ncbi:hypothetical protein ACLMAJ_30055 [Nocardia sp. KC 131]|uniref:hypothetical protein n=1 Tax=Nocardia arseniciresistens TaxID=3392119 RepID=UPI00398F6A2C
MKFKKSLTIDEEALKIPSLLSVSPDPSRNAQKILERRYGRMAPNVTDDDSAWELFEPERDWTAPQGPDNPGLGRVLHTVDGTSVLGEPDGPGLTRIFRSSDGQDGHEPGPGEPRVVHIFHAPPLKELKKLKPPPGASDGFKAYFAKAETAIQTAVDQLGPGTAAPPPQSATLLKSVAPEDLGTGAATEAYMQSVAEVDTKKESLLRMDDKVLHTSVFVANEQNRTLSSIKTIVTELADKVEAAGTGKLKPAKETTLLRQVAAAVEAVWDKVNVTSQTNNDIAYGSGSRLVASGKAPIDSVGAGIDSGGLAGMIQAMAPMGMTAMPLTQGLSDLPGSQGAIYEDRIGNPSLPPNGLPATQVPGTTHSPGIAATQHMSGATSISGQPPQMSSAINSSGTGRPELGSLTTPWSRIARPGSRIQRHVDNTSSDEDPLVTYISADAEDAAVAETI